MYLFGQGYYYKKGHNQNFTVSGFGLNVGYFYTFQRFYNEIYLPYFGDERINGNFTYGMHMDFHFKNGWYLRGSGNVFFDKVSTQAAIINNQSRRENIEFNVGSGSLALIYEVQYKKRFYPYLGLGATYNYFQNLKTVYLGGELPRTNIDKGTKIQLLPVAGINYTINGSLDIGLEGRFPYGRLRQTTLYRPTNEKTIYNRIGIHGPMLLTTLTFRFDSRYFRRKIGKYSTNPGTDWKR